MSIPPQRILRPADFAQFVLSNCNFCFLTSHNLEKIGLPSECRTLNTLSELINSHTTPPPEFCPIFVPYPEKQLPPFPDCAAMLYFKRRL